VSALPFAEWMAVTQDRAESALGRFLPGPDCIPARLHDAMRYATLGGGKRVRPLLAHRRRRTDRREAGGPRHRRLRRRNDPRLLAGP
jgi:geranylgeranyl pyrophosphate synthase